MDRSTKSRFFFSSRRRHTRWPRDWSSDVCSSDLIHAAIWHVCAYCMWGKLSQYCLYRWNLLLRGVQHDRRAIPCLALPCSSSTWTSDDASAPVTAVRYMLLGMLSFVLYAYDYALCAPFVLARSWHIVADLLFSLPYWIDIIAYAVCVATLYDPHGTACHTHASLLCGSHCTSYNRHSSALYEFHNRLPASYLSPLCEPDIAACDTHAY